MILVHEFGHFMVAKATGMRVEEFSLGFGPYLVKRRVGRDGLRHLGRAAGRLRAGHRHAQGGVRGRGSPKARGGRGGEAARPRTARSPARRRRRRASDPEDRWPGKRALSADEIASTPLERRYYSHPLWHKLLFIVAGVAMNVDRGLRAPVRRGTAAKGRMS